uniref:Subtilase family protease n=1 Tax=Desulfovibrio sp. U5L TaxID=596152 RepID=I2PX30_9BACT
MVRDKKHIFLENLAETQLYTSIRKLVSPSTYPRRDRVRHAAFIEHRLEQAWQQARQEQEVRTAVAVPSRHGTYLEFEGAPGFDLKIESLESRRKGIRLLNVRTETVPSQSEDLNPVAITKATVFIPIGRELFFLEKVLQYKDQETTSGKPRNQALIDGVQDIHVALAEALWTDEIQFYPGDTPVACEVWLQGHDSEVETSFRSTARVLDIPIQAGSLRFPERTVVLVNANREQLGQLLAACDNLAEFRRAQATAEFWTESRNADQVEWAQSLLDRVEVDPEAGVAISILDTGANNGHALLAPILQDDDCHTCDPTWGVHDHDGHGTLMCGLAGYGNLQQALEGNGVVYVDHCLESVKLLPPHGQNDPNLYGYLTSQAASRVEIKAPHRKRVISLAVTTEDGLARGRPTSWSAALDALASGQDIGQLAPGATASDNGHESDDEKRLLIVSAGNVDNPNEWRNYAGSNLRSPIHDPAQSWNSLSVGAYTEKTFLSDPTLAGHVAVAPCGGLSPFSSTSLTWENKWPAKPDILMEGGNVVRDAAGFCTTCDDTSLLSTSHKPTQHQFGLIHATSAATAQAAWMAARIQAMYPQAWPETVRGLMVHSADWTNQMRQAFLGAGTKTDYGRLLRICGYGVPDLQRALHCASNSLTLIAQDTLQPFGKKEGGSSYCTKDMHLYELPWPKVELESLGDTELTLRITLSYFIEPSPGEVGWKNRYRYQSHALRFDLNSPLEDRRQFLVRLNRAARDEGEEVETPSGSDRWLVGSIGRSRGSIHSDIWKGPAIALAECNLVGIYPVIGWWRERAWLSCWSKRARYSLIVSLHSPAQEVDIYTPVAVAVAPETEVTIPSW